MSISNQVFPNPLMCYTFPVDIESSAQFQKPTKPSVADFSKRAVSGYAFYCLVNDL